MRVLAGGAVVALVLSGCGERIEREALRREMAGAPAAPKASPLLNALVRPGGDARVVAETRRALPEHFEGEACSDFDGDTWLIDDLAADDIPFNGQAALAKVWWDWDVPLEPYVAALRSKDRQQRLLAADYLRHRNYEPVDDLVKVSIETVRYHDDDIGGELPFLLARSVRYLERHAEKVEMQLLQGLRSEDGQLRFYAAAILARSRSRAALPVVCSILALHLEDNYVSRDAGVAALSLRELGELAQPYVSFEKNGASEQGWTVLRILELSHIHRTVQEEREFLQLQRQDPIGVLHRSWRGWTRQALPMGRALFESPRWR